MLVFCLLIASLAHASDDRKQALDELRAKIDKLNRDLVKSEESRTEVTEQLRASEKQISESNRALSALGREQLETARALRGLEERIKAARRDLAREESVRDELLRHQYMHGSPDALRLALSGEDVASVERQIAYLGYVTRARVAAIGQISTRLATLGALEAESREKESALAANAKAQKAARETLVAERVGRQKVLDRIRGDINRNRREVGRLKQDENRLAKLVEQIAAELARRAKPKEDLAKPRRPGQPVTESADASAQGRAFQSLRGRLKLPVRGELASRFGAQREDGGVTWKGLFIRAEEGAPVRAVADGRVVYADWLRGYGNLVIVDHGGGYLSLYGHNESIVKQVGEQASAGEAIASVGSTGGAQDPGVYFELRQDGKPFDPARWMAR
jgi:septal ring factor EnvC (AmiA/AmiB activator)